MKELDLSEGHSSGIPTIQEELEEAKKENLFLKKAAAFFAKEID